MSLRERIRLFVERLHGYSSGPRDDAAYPATPGKKGSAGTSGLQPRTADGPVPSVRQEPAQPGGTPTLPDRWPDRVLFICSGNICRSAYAPVVFNRLLKQHGRECAVFSAGTLRISNRPAAPSMIQAALVHGDDLSQHRSTPLSVALLQASDLIFVMSPEHEQVCLSMLPECHSRLCRLSYWLSPPAVEIPDPMGREYNAYLIAADQICRALDRWFAAWEQPSRKPQNPQLDG